MPGTIETKYLVASLATMGLLAAHCLAATPPFTEDFTSDVANWGDNTSDSFTLNLIDFVASGGPDGSSYASISFTFDDPNAEGDTPVLFRGHDIYNSSGDAFVGDWRSEGVRYVSAQVHHDAPLPLNFFMRAAGSGNFPGGVAIDFVPILPGVWSEIEFWVAPNSPQFVTFEGTDHTAVFTAVGNLQFGISVPTALATGIPTNVTFDIDKITIATPEPSTVCLAGMSLLGCCGLGRRPRK